MNHHEPYEEHYFLNIHRTGHPAIKPGDLSCDNKYHQSKIPILLRFILEKLYRYPNQNQNQDQRKNEK
jgi:hypothetical protein